MSIELKNVSRSFAAVKAVDGVTLTLEPGKIYGLLGRNGAGKSTLLNLLTGRLAPTAGEILVDGAPVWENDRAMGRMYLMSEANCYPESLRVGEVFRWTGEFYGGFDTERAAGMCEQFGLSQRKKIKGLSTGYTSIYKLITALCVDTDYVLLDEPVLGLDANHRELFYRLLLEQYAAHERTYVISTHLIEEVAAVLEDVLILKEGKLIRNCPCEELLRAGYNVSGTAAAVDAYLAGKDILGAETLGGLKTASVLGRPENVPAGLEVTALDLQKLFIQLTNS